MYRLTGVEPMNSVKKFSDENKSDVAKWVWKIEWWVMSNDLWVMEIEWRKLSDEKSLPKQPLTSHPYASLVGRNISFNNNIVCWEYVKANFNLATN